MNHRCPKCGFELRVGRCMYLHSVKVYYFCGAEQIENKDCKFRFDNDGRGWSSETRLREAFENRFIKKTVEKGTRFYDTVARMWFTVASSPFTTDGGVCYGCKPDEGFWSADRKFYINMMVFNKNVIHVFLNYET